MNEVGRYSNPNYVANPDRRIFLRRLGKAAQWASLAGFTGSLGGGLKIMDAIEDSAEKEANKQFPKPDKFLVEGEKDVVEFRATNPQPGWPEASVQLLGENQAHHIAKSKIGEQKGRDKAILGMLSGMIGSVALASVGRMMIYKNR